MNTTSCLDQNTYAIVDDLLITRLKIGCLVKLVVTFGHSCGFEPEDVSSNKHIHKKLAHGFELSWLHSVCTDYRCGSASYYFNDSTGKVLCDEKSPLPCHYVHHNIDQCGKEE